MKDRRNGRYSLRVIEMVKPQMFTQVKLVTMSERVKPARAWQRVKPSRRTRIQRNQACGWATKHTTSTIPTARCGPACRVVWEGGVSHNDSPPIPIPAVMELDDPAALLARRGAASERDTGKLIPRLRSTRLAQIPKVFFLAGKLRESAVVGRREAIESQQNGGGKTCP